MVPNIFYNKTFQDKISKLFPLDYDSKALSQDIEMNKGSLVYVVCSNGKKTRVEWCIKMKCKFQIKYTLKIPLYGSSDIQ